ncbi:hypothetical protein [Undibacterium sp. TC9W]|uniref:hypothetical protein n=1 Tax=Undibacterium sp. TC9W TaxID=3413053 RepID=UPI003BF1D539
MRTYTNTMFAVRQWLYRTMPLAVFLLIMLGSYLLIGKLLDTIFIILSSVGLALVDCNSGIESEGHVPGASGQGAKHSDSGAIASICNAAMIVAHMAGTPIATVTVHYTTWPGLFLHIQRA